MLPEFSYSSISFQLSPTFQEEGTVRSTPFGRLASVYYLEHMSIRFLTSTMKAKMSVEQVLTALTVRPFRY